MVRTDVIAPRGDAPAQGYISVDGRARSSGLAEERNKKDLIIRFCKNIGSNCFFCRTALSLIEPLREFVYAAAASKMTESMDVPGNRTQAKWM